MIDYTVWGERELIEKIYSLESTCNMMEDENRNMALALKNLGYSDKQISEICSS